MAQVIQRYILYRFTIPSIKQHPYIGWPWRTFIVSGLRHTSNRSSRASFSSKNVYSLFLLRLLLRLFDCLADFLGLVFDSDSDLEELGFWDSGHGHRAVLAHPRPINR